MKASPIPSITIVIVPRERFSAAEQSLESLFNNTSLSFEQIVVDGGSPEPLASRLRQTSELRNFTLLRSERFLSPNQARNRALRHRITSEWVVFADNDVIFAPGWLEALMACAESTGADMVSPLYLEGPLADTRIHMAGGQAHFRQLRSRRIFFERHHFCKRRITSVRQHLRRELVELFEFHCVLFRLSLLEAIGPFDEALLSTADHVDACLKIRQLGGRILFEPAAVVSYLTPERLDPMDLAYFQLRWSDDWNRRTLDHVRCKWRLEPGDPYLAAAAKWLKRHQQLASERPLHALVGAGHGSWLNRTCSALYRPVWHGPGPPTDPFSG
jgi:GT2 family glycosyltransferase